MAGARQRIWITRTQPGAAATADRVRALGHEAVVAPLLEIRVLENVGVDMTDVVAVAFTSANGVRAFADRQPDRQVKVFAVGAATAQAARAAGFRTVLSSDGDVTALADGIAKRWRDLVGGVVLHPGAVEPAGDLVGLLEQAGVRARGLALYDSGPVKLSAEAVADLTACDAVLLHSPKAAKALAGLLKATPAPHLRALGLSKAVLKPLARTPMAAKLFPPIPLEAALLNLVDRSA